MNLTPPTFEELREILLDLDAPQALEFDAFRGQGLWDAEGEAARLAAFARVLPAHLVRDDAGRPALAFGVSLERPGVLQTWLCSRRGWQAVNERFTQEHAQATAVLLASGTVHRIQVVSLAHRPRVRPWIERLGYVHEGLQRQAGAQGEDFDLYAMRGGA